MGRKEDDAFYWSSAYVYLDSWIIVYFSVFKLYRGLLYWRIHWRDAEEWNGKIKSKGWQASVNNQTRSEQWVEPTKKNRQLKNNKIKVYLAESDGKKWGKRGGYLGNRCSSNYYGFSGSNSPSVGNTTQFTHADCSREDVNSCQSVYFVGFSFLGSNCAIEVKYTSGRTNSPGATVRAEWWSRNYQSWRQLDNHRLFSLPSHALYLFSPESLAAIKSFIKTLSIHWCSIIKATTPMLLFLQFHLDSWRSNYREFLI